MEVTHQNPNAAWDFCLVLKENGSASKGIHGQRVLLNDLRVVVVRPVQPADLIQTNLVISISLTTLTYTCSKSVSPTFLMTA
jgi:hypothetical protein